MKNIKKEIESRFHIRIKAISERALIGEKTVREDCEGFLDNVTSRKANKKYRRFTIYTNDHISNSLMKWCELKGYLIEFKKIYP